jgi:hypothetical protein
MGKRIWSTSSAQSAAIDATSFIGGVALYEHALSSVPVSGSLGMGKDTFACMWALRTPPVRAESKTLALNV